MCANRERPPDLRLYTRCNWYRLHYMMYLRVTVIKVALDKRERSGNKWGKWLDRLLRLACTFRMSQTSVDVLK